MRVRAQKRIEDPTAIVVGDLFSGLMMVMLLILIVVWLQAFVEAMEIRRLREIRQIFADAFEAVGQGSAYIEVDRDRGEIILKAEQLFPSGDWAFSPDSDNLRAFVEARSTVAQVLDRVSDGFERRDLNAEEFVELRVVGHTDCAPYVDSRSALQDNLDLSVLRAAAVARFLTEPCAGGDYACCPTGLGTSCDESARTRRVDPHRWQVLPVGRSYFEPRELKPEQREKFDEQHCAEALKAGDLDLKRQRRVVIQIVPRLDRLLVRDFLK